MYHAFAKLFEPLMLCYLLTGLGLVMLWWRRREARWRLAAVTLPFVLLMLLSLPVVAHVALGTLEWQYPPRAQMPNEAEAIVVLSGYVYPPDAVRQEPELAEDTLYRCLHAVRLYRRQGPLPVVVTGGLIDGEPREGTLAEAMKSFLLESGVAERDVLVEKQARTTYENATGTRDLLDDRGIRRIVLVTSAVHMLRSELTFRNQGFEVTPAPCRRRATQLDWEVSAFLPSANALLACHEAAHEWIGLAWYWLTGKLG